MKYSLVKNNLALFQIYRLRTLFILFLFLMCIDIKYDKLISLVIPILACILYAIDGYREYKSTKIYNKLKKLLRFVRVALSIIVSSYFNIVIAGEIVKVTGFSYNNFSLSSYVLFLTTLIIFSLPISLIVILFISFVYEFKLLSLSVIRFSKRNMVKITHYFIMFLIPIIFSMKIYDKTNVLIISEMSQLFQNILVYSSYTNIPERCQNKLNLEQNYNNIQVAFLDHEKMSISYSVNGKLLFGSALCKDNYK